MGFYGNITNTSKTQFQFDKTFPNRAVMDQFIGTDGVYIGRYVLVEYDKALAADWCVTAYKKTVNGVIHFYTSQTLESTTEISYRYANIEEGKYIRIPGSFYDVDGNWITYNLDNPEITHDLLYYIKAPASEETILPINVALVAEKNWTENDYIVNYNTDRLRYGGGRGYDSTVWQKVYADGIERYVMIAELNSVVPTFGVSADAPTLSPVAPHFDVDSTNIYYKVHWQPSWGLRVKAAAPTVSVRPTNEYGETVNGNELILSDILESPLPSDETTVWKRAVYDTRSGLLHKYYFDSWTDFNTNIVHGEWIESEDAPLDAAFPAAIYYNKDGFNPAIISYSDKNIVDKISIEPSGLSGAYYNTHQGTESTPQIDTQELSILLPSIGDSVAKMWDIVYGTEEINQSTRRNMTIDWSEGSIIPNLSGLRLVTKAETGYGFNRRNASTLAGAINSVHDLMGMIIREVPVLKSGEASWGKVDALNEDYIYYLPAVGQYTRKQKQYEYLPLNAPEIEGEEPPAFEFNKEERFLEGVMFDENWVLPHTKYYLDFPESNPIENNNQYPNVILESQVYHADGRQYYSTAYLEKDAGHGPFTTESFGGVFEPYTFFELNNNREITINNRIYKVPAYQISLDEEYNNSKGYYVISHTFLGDNTRFWVEGEYLVGTFTPYADHTQLDFESRILFEKIEVEGKERYVRPEVYDLGGQYYTATFESDSGNYDSNKQYFVVNKKVENNKTYIEKIDYIPVPIADINEVNFYYRTYYTTTDRIIYTIATSYTPDTQYYHKKVSLQLVEANTSVSAENVNEVDVVLYRANMGYCKYFPRGTGGTNSLDEYIVLNDSLIPSFASMDNLVQITITAITNIYQPNLYYYEITDEGNPLKGSFVFDANTLPTPGREYYTRYAIHYGDPVVQTFYEPYKYYYYNENTKEYVLETSERPTSNRTYLEKNGIYVLNDPLGRFPKGMEWNLNVNPVPAGILVGEREEKWGLEELYGFARHYTTIHGLILRLSKILESKNNDVRDFESAQGMLNKLKDILVNFGETHDNEIMVTDKYGRIISTGLVDDDWISATYNNDDNEGKISIVHQYIGEESGLGDHEVKGEEVDRTLVYGGTFISPSFKFNTDSMGHVNSFSTDFKTMTMPTLDFVEDTEGNVVIDITMSEGSGSNKVTFTEKKVNVGTLGLTEYTKAENEVDVTLITPLDSINSGFAKINTAFNSLDYEMTAAQNNYVSAVTETNGIINVETASTATITSLGTITSGTWDSTIAQDRVTTLSITNAAVTTEKINNAAVTTEKINNSAVTTEKIADGNIVNSKLASSGLDISKFTTGTLFMDRIAPGSIETVKIANSAITEEKINTGAVTEAKIGNLAVTNGKIAEGAITTSKIVASAITTELINNSAITSDKILSGAVITDKIANNAITSDKILDGAVTSAKIASLDASKIQGTLTANNIPTLNMDKITEGNLEGSRVVLTNYNINSIQENQTVSTSDTVITAIAKLEKRIAALEEKVHALEENNTTTV